MNKYPTIDVHGETTDTIYTVLLSFIKDNLKLKNRIIVVIHGKGKGVLKKEIHYHLKKMKEVNSFCLDYWNQGMAIIELNV